MKIKQLYEDFNVTYATEGSRNVAGGWIGTHCPFCPGAPDNHLGYNLDGNYFSCWRCGKHPTVLTLTKLLSVDEKTAKSLIKKYGGVDGASRISIRRESKTFKFPSNCGDLQSMHKQYLLRRGFDPDRLARDWDLRGTGPVSNLDGADYRFRIIAPIRWDEDIVSFQGRSLSDKTDAKYKACPKEYEKVHHKHILYGNQERWGSTGILVEGITDVWRLGPLSAATFGIKFTDKQVLTIGKSLFERIYIIFDNEPQAQQQAKKLKSELKAFYKDPKIEIITVDGDPGGMEQNDADYLIKQLIK